MLEVVNHLDNGYDYLRCGQMLRQLPFAKNGDTVTVLEIGNKTQIAQWQNTVFRSSKDKSVAVYVVNFGDKAAENTLLLPDGKEWGLGSKSKVFSWSANGERKLLGNLENLRELKLQLPADGIAAFVVVPEK